MTSADRSKSAAVVDRLGARASRAPQAAEGEQAQPSKRQVDPAVEAAEARKPELVSARLALVRQLYSLGIRPFPLNMETDGKEPRPGSYGWAEPDFDPSQEQCEQWAREGNLGIPSGGRLFFIDVDKPEDPAVQEFVATLPANAPFVTSGKGFHVWLLQPEGEQLGNGRGNLPDGIDLRGARGYVVAPGSWHYERRCAYEFVGDFDPSGLVAVPEHVVARLKAPRSRNGRAIVARVVSDEEAQARDAALTDAQQVRVRNVVQGLFRSDVERVRIAAPNTSQNTYYETVCNVGNYLSGGIVTEDEADAQLSALIDAAREREVEGIEATTDSGMRMGSSKPKYAFEVLAELNENDTIRQSGAERLVEHLRASHLRRNINRNMPEDEEVLGLIERKGANGQSYVSHGAGAVKKVAKGLPIVRVFFEHGLIVEPLEQLSRDDTLARLRELLVPIVRKSVGCAEPRLLYALAHGALVQLDGDGWREACWSILLDEWDAAEAELEARAEEERERQAQVDDLTRSILDGARETFLNEEVPDDPAWIRSRLMFIAGSEVFLLDATGHLPSQSYSRDQLSRAVEAHGLSELIQLKELRSQSLHTFSGQEIINRTRPWAVSKVTYRVGLQHSVLERTGEHYVIVLPQYPLANIEPADHADIDAWIEHIFRHRAEEVRDWFAGVPEAALPTPALVIEGPDGIGKDMFAIGCAQVFRDPEFSRGRAFDRFNPIIAKNPVTFFDEGLPDKAHGGSVSEKLREMISGGFLPVEAKGKDVRYIEARPRAIIATNDMDKVVRVLASERLNRASAKAIEARVLAVRVPKDARSYLSERGNWEHTRDWCDPNKRLFARYILWLHAERIERLRSAGTRFLGEPSSEKLLGGQVYDDPATIAYVECICRLFAQPGDKAVLVGPGDGAEPGLYFRHSALSDRRAATRRDPYTFAELDGTGDDVGLHDMPPTLPSGQHGNRTLRVRGVTYKAKYRYSSPSQLLRVRDIAEHNGIDHSALDRFLVAIGALDASECEARPESLSNAPFARSPFPKNSN